MNAKVFQKNSGRAIIDAALRRRLVALCVTCLAFAGACSPGDAEQQAREGLDYQADLYERLLQERESHWLEQTRDGMLKMLFIEAERSRSEEERTSLALKLEDRMTRFGDGIRAMSLGLKYKSDPDFRPFIAVWSIDGGEFQRAVTGDAIIPEAALKDLRLSEGETMFTDGADDERRIEIRMYYSDAVLQGRLENIRAQSRRNLF
ncbi:MAG: hypothetical protein NXI24_07740 [bacterium]|nr:hypothetical protein [bacterium]